MRTILLLVFLLFTVSACSGRVDDPNQQLVPSATLPAFSTATLPPTYTLRPDLIIPQQETVTPTLQPTIQPLSGYVNSNINVRSGPGQSYDSLGLIPPATTVFVVGKDSTGEWLLVQYETAPLGVGWVTSQYVVVTGNQSRLPVLDIPPYVAATPTSAVTQMPTPSGALSAQTTQQVNVRSGPGTVYDTLGQIASGQTVAITGRNETSTWLQIAYAESPDGRGWVAALYLRLGDDLADLPFLDQNGNPLTVLDESGNLQATPTPGPVANDSDSASRPAASLSINPYTSRLVSFQNAVSAPQGDASDTILLTVDGQQPVKVQLSLNCTGMGDVRVTASGDANLLPGWPLDACSSQAVVFTFQPGVVYLMEIAAGEPGDGPVSVQYVLKLTILQ